MKVAYLLGSLNRGGTETLLLDVFRKAANAAFPFVGVHRKNGAYKDDFYATEVPMFQVSFRSKFDFGYFVRLRKLLKRENVTIVHAQQYIDAIFAKIACVGTGIKVVETFHGYDFGAGKLERWLIKRSLHWCDAVFFVSNAQKRYYTEKYALKNAEKLSVVYNGVNFEKLGEISQRKSPSATENGVLKFGMVGNFVRGREQNTVTRFLKLLHDKGLLFEFCFVGARNDKEPWRYDDCVRYCEENDLMDCVKFLGSRRDVPQLLSQWDAFVYSTDHDTFGIAVIEAIATGLPTFVNDWEVMREITQDGQMATLYKTRDEYDLLDRFIDFLNHRDDYAQKAIENAEAVRLLYGIEAHLSRLCACYGSLKAC